MRQRPASHPAARLLALALVVTGAAILVGAIFADRWDLIGAGVGFGWKQLLAVIGGLVILLLGVSWLWQPLGSGERDESME